MTDSMMERIRNLLAKAEATTFQEEAHAFTEKAQELMQKYAIDQAMLEASRPGHVSKPVMVKLPIPQPYGVWVLVVRSTKYCAKCGEYVTEMNTTVSGDTWTKKLVHIDGDGNTIYRSHQAVLETSHK